MAEKSKASIEENKAQDADVLDLDEDQSSNLIKRVMDDHESDDAARQEWMRDKEEGLQLYWGMLKPKNFPWENCSNLHVPLIRTISDTLHSNIMGSIDTEKPASVVPVGPEDIPKGRKIEKLLNWRFTSQVDYTDIVDKISQSVLVYGVAPVKTRYVIERDERGDKTFDGLKVEVIPAERFLYPADAGSTDVNAMEHSIHEIVMSPSDLKKRLRDGRYRNINTEEVERLATEMTLGQREAGDQLQNIRDLYTGEDSLGHGRPQRKLLTILEWCGHYDYNKDGVEERVMAWVLKEGKKLLKAVVQRRKRGVTLITFSDVLHKVAGESVPDLLKHINKELNTLHNQRVDAVTIQNIPFFFFDPLAGFNPNNVRLTPGLGVPVNGSPSQAVYFPTLSTTRPEMYREEELLFLYAERMLGAGANVQGVTQPKRTSATEVAAVDRRAGIRFLTIFNRIRRGLRDIFRTALELEKEFMPPELQVRITGITAQAPVFETIKKDELEAQVDIVVNGNSVLDEMASKQEQMQIYQIGMANPLIARDETAVYELTRDLFVKIGAKRIDSYLHQPEDNVPRSPDEEHNLFLQEEYIRPHIRENVGQHLTSHAELINSESFKLMSPKAQALTIKHYAETKRMEETLERWRLVNQATAVNQMLMQTQMIGEMPMSQNGQPQANGVQVQQRQGQEDGRAGVR